METSLSNKALTVIQWNEKQFASRQVAWNNLLSASNADPIFCSWEWMYNWWKQRNKNTDILSIFVLAKGSEVIGIAPFYIESDSYLRGTCKTSRLQFIGKRFSGKSGIRAECLEIIFRKDTSKCEMNTLFEAIYKDIKWSELCFTDVRSNCIGYQQFEEFLESKKLYQREDASGVTYAIDCSQNYQVYLSNLGKKYTLKTI